MKTTKNAGCKQQKSEHEAAEQWWIEAHVDGGFRRPNACFTPKKPRMKGSIWDSDRQAQ